MSEIDSGLQLHQAPSAAACNTVFRMPCDSLMTCLYSSPIYCSVRYLVCPLQHAKRSPGYQIISGRINGRFVPENCVYI